MVEALRVVNYEELPPSVDLYSCYSPNLKEYLVENGVEYIYSCRNNKTDRIKWIFIESDRLSALLTIWSNNKPKEVVADGEDCGTW